ncbi:MAG: Mu transposase C-terminal domain-containing protein [Acidimicrobiales bacterium]
MGDRPTLTELDDSARASAMACYDAVLRPHLEHGVPLTNAAEAAGVPLRTAQRWLARYRSGGLAALARQSRVDRGQRKLPAELQSLIEGMALRRPPLSAAGIHRQAARVATEHGWAVPSYACVHDIVTNLDPAMVLLAQEGAKAYGETFDLVWRRESDGPNEIWQADHTLLDLWALDPAGDPVRPWLTAIEDDHSRALAGWSLNVGAPSALQTALAFRKAIWPKSDPRWHVCGIPGAFYVDHGSDFTSRHLEQVSAELKVGLVFSTVGIPRGRGKVERFFRSVNQLLLCTLPGYAPAGGPPPTPTLRLAELEALIHEFVIEVYHRRPHSETGVPPQERWEAGGFLPRLPASPEALDLLLLTVAEPRKVHPDGIRFQGLRYFDPTLAAFVGEAVVIRYDPLRGILHIGSYVRPRIMAEAALDDGVTSRLAVVRAA